MAAALTDNGLLIGGVPSQFVPGDMLISIATAGQVNLIINTGGFGLQFWDGANTVGNGAVEGGTGTWVNAATNWTADDGGVNAPWQGGFAVFQGTAGTVTLGENIAFEGMQFLSTGYVIDGGGFGLAAGPDTIIRVDPSVTATINAPIADGTGGAARLTKSDAGLLVLGGSNSYSGGTLVNGGALQIGADASLGAASGALGLDARHADHDRQLRFGAQRHARREWRHFLDRHRHPAHAWRPDHGPGRAGQGGRGHAHPLRREQLCRRHLARRRRAGRVERRQSRRRHRTRSISTAARCASTPASTRSSPGPSILGDLGGTIDTNGNDSTFAQGIVRHRSTHQGGRRHADAHRREQLFRRHHDQRRHVPDRQWRNHRQPHRRHRQ